MASNQSTRALHLVDIENVCAGQVSEAACAVFLNNYTALQLAKPHDLVVVGAGPGAMACTFSLPMQWRRVLGHGIDGADLALLDALPDPRRLGTFAELVIASGDHLFRTAADRAHGCGLTVTVVAAHGTQSRLLHAVADRHVCLDLELAA